MNHIHKFLAAPSLSLYFLFLLAQGQPVYAYTVSDLVASCQNGQVFLTWTNPAATNLQYNVYRSKSEFTSSSQLTTSKFLGFVRDNSSKNIFWSEQANEDVYFKIEDDGDPLSPDQGLYVVTCTDDEKYYYAVTVTKLGNNNEDKTIVTGENSLSSPVMEKLAKPQPVFQSSIILDSDEIKDHYVQFGNNQDTPLYPAMNSTGSYGFNFYIIKRGSASSYALFVLFEGFGGNPEKGANLESTYSDCYILGVFDWLPIQKGSNDIGDNTYFSGYHTKFNIYTDENPIPTGGVIRTYPQHRYLQNILWMQEEFPIDTTRIYLKGTSANGFGALLTATIIPEKIAAVYAVTEPTNVNPVEEIYDQMWGSTSNIKSDVLDWSKGDTLRFSKLTEIKKMFDVNEERSVPPIYDVHGKNDKQVSWTAGKVEWLDSLEANHLGGAWYWDQREHGGEGKNFENEETEPNYYRFATNKAYPAFGNCSINQNPGNGGDKNGDDYGAINGYLDWRDSLDQDCRIWMNFFVKDFYVGGVLDPEQYTTCTTDITFRRMQNFNPPPGSTLRWKNFDANGTKIQNELIEYNGGLITIKGVTVNKSGNLIKLRIQNCDQRLEEDDYSDFENSEVEFGRTPQGYTMTLFAGEEQDATIFLFDLAGRMVRAESVHFVKGINSVDIPSPGSGIYLLNITGELISVAEKLSF